MTTTLPTSAALKAGTERPADGPKTTIDHAAFLKLLTAQLQNQDPLAPMDATQFMTQLAQLSTVEQGVQTNRTLKEVLEELRSSGLRGDLGFIGRRVEAASDALPLTGGRAQTAYAVEGTPRSVKVEVMDPRGRVVHTAAGHTGPGRHVFEWNGRTADGSTAPDGLYTIRVVARDADGKPLTAATVTSGTVTQVRSVDGEAHLVLEGGATVRGADVLAAL